VRPRAVIPERIHFVSRSPAMAGSTLGLDIRARSGPGVLHELAGLIARRRGDIASVEIAERSEETTRIYLEIDSVSEPDALVAEMRASPVVVSLDVVETFQRVYGKRIIIMGGGAQVGQVAIGAISEADRHNIRGEHISVDTIPLVGEQPLAEAVRAVTRLPRAKALVLAGALMGGEIEAAVREVRAQGLLVISLNMAGSVPDAADLVVSDPVQAGVMAVMAVAETAKFTVARLKRRVF
jgi:energy-converting hydrogenase B subunit Q